MIGYLISNLNSFPGQLLEDESKLSDYSIDADSVVRLEFYEKVHFMNKTGKITPILFPRGFTLGDLQASVENEFNIPIKAQLLTYEGEQNSKLISTCFRQESNRR